MDIRQRTKNKYLRNLYGILAIISGSFLIIEHIWNWGVFEKIDFFGHEWLGLLLIIFGILLNLDYKTK